MRAGFRPAADSRLRSNSKLPFAYVESLLHLHSSLRSRDPGYLPERNAVRVPSDEIAPTKPSSRIGVAGPPIAGTIQILVRWPFGNCIGSRPSSIKSRSSLRTALPSNIWISPEKRPPLKQVHASLLLNCDGQRTPHTLIRIRSERQSFRHNNLRLQSRSGDLRLCQVTEVVEVPAWRRSS